MIATYNYEDIARKRPHQVIFDPLVHLRVQLFSYAELQLWMQGCTFICEHGGDFCFQTVCKLFREGTHKHVPPKVERRLGIEGCDRRSDLRWPLADGWVKVDAQLVPFTYIHMWTQSHTHATCCLLMALTFPDGICFWSRVSLKLLDLSDRNVSAIPQSCTPGVKIVSSLSAENWWQVYHCRMESCT